MTLQHWIDWCRKQLADLSLRLLRQGYDPIRIEELEQNSPEFRKQYGLFLANIDEIMAQMAINPEGYHHFEAFTKAKKAFLEFTNLNREQFLLSDLAQTA